MRTTVIWCRVLIAALVCVVCAPTSATAVDYGEGAIVQDGGGVKFRVYGPGAVTVSVAGDFNNWNPNADPMAVDADGYWETTVGDAQPGQKYKYVVNGSLWRKDPWSFAVENSSDEAASIIVDLGAFDWSAESDAFETPRIEDVVIMQIHLRSFMYNNDGLTYEPGQVFNDFTDHKLDYLTDLGVNAIHLMPINEFPGDQSWGYNHVFFHALESSYGTAADFQRLVDECHKRGIAVIVGVCFNHTDGRDNVHLWDFDGTADNPYGGNGQFYFNDDRALTLWGPEPNYDHPRARARMLENVRMWIEEYRISGFRMDAVGFIRGESNDGNDWFGWQAEEGWRFLRDFNNIARSYQNGRFMSIAEDIASNPSITQNTGEGGAGFLSQWAETNVRWLMSTPNDGDRNMDELNKVLGHWYPVNYGFHELVKYHSSHDKVGALNNGLRLPSLIGDPQAWYAKSRTKQALAIIMNAAGTPLFFMGDEFYETGTWEEEIGRGVDWSLPFHTNRWFYEFSRDLIALKLNAPALSVNNLEIPISDNNEKLVTWRRWGENGEVIVYAANLSANDKAFWIPFPSDGRWHTIIHSDWTHYGGGDPSNYGYMDISGTWGEVWMPAYTFKAFGTTHEIAPGRVWNVTPVSGGQVGTPAPTLQWQSTARAESYNLMLGTDAAAVAAAGSASPEWLGNTTATQWPLADLDPGIYYWRADSVNGVGVTTSKVFRLRVLEAGAAASGRVAWSPDPVYRGESFELTYDAWGGLLEGSAGVTAHLGFVIGGTPWIDTTDYPMTHEGGGLYSLSVDVPLEAEAVGVVFRNEADLWDNNNSSDWFVPATERPNRARLWTIY